MNDADSTYHSGCLVSVITDSQTMQTFYNKVVIHS